MDLLTILIVLLLLFWFLGMGTAYTLGGLVHILLVVALVLVVVRLAKGTRL